MKWQKEVAPTDRARQPDQPSQAARSADLTVTEWPTRQRVAPTDRARLLWGARRSPRRPLNHSGGNGLPVRNGRSALGERRWTDAFGFFRGHAVNKRPPVERWRATSARTRQPTPSMKEHRRSVRAVSTSTEQHRQQRQHRSPQQHPSQDRFDRIEQRTGHQQRSEHHRCHQLPNRTI